MKMEINNIDNYVVYFETTEKMFRVWYSKNDEFKTLKFIPRDCSHFYMTGKQYEANDDDLRRYGQDLFKANEQLKSSKTITFDYIKPLLMKNGNYYFRSHTANVETLFKMLCKGKYEHLEPITATEAIWMDKPHNGGLMFLSKGTYQSYAYDFSNFYGSILGSKKFYFPIRPGTEYTLNELPEKLKFGFYRMKITCDNPNIKKLFSFSVNNTYNSNSVLFAQELIKKGYDIEMNLIQDREPNAYLYEMQDMTTSDKIFGKWYSTILKLKAELPGNMLLKMLSSSLWGHLSTTNIKNVPEEEAEQLNIGLSKNCDWYIMGYVTQADGTSFYKLMDNKKPYKYNLRLKPFITAHGRNVTARVVADHIDDVIKINTDGICFTKPLDKEIENFVVDSKYTGLIEFINYANYKIIKN